MFLFCSFLAMLVVCLKVHNVSQSVGALVLFLFGCFLYTHITFERNTVNSIVEPGTGFGLIVADLSGKITARGTF